MSKNVSTEPDCVFQETLGAVLGEYLGRTIAVERIERKPIAYASSYCIEEWLAEAGGESLRVIFKDVGPQARLPSSRDAKPEFLYNPEREIAAYGSLLGEFYPQVPRCYGARVDAAAGRYWLFLECVEGDQLWQIGDLAIWSAAAARLAGMHRAFLGCESTLKKAGPLLVYDAAFFRRWAERAAGFAKGRSAEDRAFLAELAGKYERVVEPLTAWPRTLLHGECYASNILADAAAGRVCFVDWEMAAIGPGLVDLAALTAGKWSAADKEQLSLAYHRAMVEAGVHVPEAGEFLRLLAFARLHVAVQWLGWSEEWKPPADHAHDWMGEARELACMLKVL